MNKEFEIIVKGKKNDELIRMVYQLDQWDSEMLKAVEAELLRRQSLPSDINQRKKEIIDNELLTLEKGEKASLSGQILGWVFIFGLFGLLIGYNYAYSKFKSKYTTKVFYKYDKQSRENGTYIFYSSIGAVSVPKVRQLQIRD